MFRAKDVTVMNHLRIAVFDFIGTECDYTAEAIRQFYRGLGLEIPEVVTWTENHQFRRHLMEMARRGEHYDMVFISADSMPGTDLAHTVRAIDKRCPLFLVSKSVEFAVEGFRMQALDYLTKPVSPERVGQAIARIMSPAGDRD